MGSLLKLASFLRPYRKLVIFGPLLMVVEVAMDLMQPRLIQQIVDVGIANLDFNVIFSTGLLMIGLAFIGVLGGVGNTILGVRVAQNVGADLRSTLFRKVQSLSFGNLDRLETGQIITRLTNDVVQIQEVVLITLRIMVRAPLLLVGSLILAVITSPRLALLLVVLIPVLLSVLVLVLRRAHPVFLAVQRRLDWLNTVMQENLAGVRVVKVFVRTDFEEGRFNDANNRLKDQSIKAFRLVALVMPFMMLALNFGVAGVVWFGGIQVSAGTMHVGQIIAFVNYLLQTLFALMMVGMLITRVSRAEASAERILEVLHSEPDIKNRPNAQTTFSPAGKVTFKDVSFHYNGNNHEPVLKKINFTAEAGQTVAILGATGSGKSTLVNLIPRFYEVSEGQITIDGTNIQDIETTALRKNIGIALQESVLFSGTIRDNIRYGRPNAPDETVIAAAKAAQAHQFIMGFPNGYDTEIGQRGVNLSGGQKQRLAIARALITEPAILVLDDSTSAVDVETESKIQAAMDKIMVHRTSFIIAQRISTVLNADKILVLDDGELVAEGSHTDLMASSPIYREIYESQLGKGTAIYG